MLIGVSFKTAAVCHPATARLASAIAEWITTVCRPIVYHNRVENWGFNALSTLKMLLERNNQLLSTSITTGEAKLLCLNREAVLQSGDTAADAKQTVAAVGACPLLFSYILKAITLKYNPLLTELYGEGI